MTWDDVDEWLSHLFNDPIRENWWALGLVVGLVVLSIAGVATLLVGVWQDRRRAVQWRRNRGDGTVNASDRSNAEDTIEQARVQDDGNPDGAYSYVETPQQQKERRDRQAHRRHDAPDGTTGTATALNLPPDESQWVTLGVTEQGRAYEPGDEASTAELPNPEPLANTGAGQDGDISEPAPDESGAINTEPGRPTCPTCRGRGYVPTTNDLLRESIALVADGGDVVVREFYTRLLHAAPDLAALFPPDLLTASTGDELSDGYGQRNRLLGALVSLSQFYNPADAQGMARLNVVLTSWGGRHAAFLRPDGTVRGATLAEYEAVKQVLFGTLVAAAGDRWHPEYTAAWDEAYEHAAKGMIAGEYALICERGGELHPREPRA